MKINIVYATILGTSQMVAEELDDALSDKYEIDVQDILQISPAELSR
jgi:flavodoxin